MDTALQGAAAVVMFGIIMSFGIVIFGTAAEMRDCRELPGGQPSNFSPDNPQNPPVSDTNTDAGSWARLCYTTHVSENTALAILAIIITITAVITFILVLKAIR